MTGIVKDTSGAVLPGVTVEASSEALIEKSKVAITDGEGRYLIPDLRPGTYVVTFSLTGFSTIRRTELSLPSEFTMTLNADLRVGALEESITVTGDAPVVDVTTAVHTQVLNREAMDAIPTGRTIQGLGPARRRHQPEPARHRRRARDAADLHVDPRHDRRPTTPCWWTA